MKQAQCPPTTRTTSPHALNQPSHYIRLAFPTYDFLRTDPNVPCNNVYLKKLLHLINLDHKSKIFDPFTKPILIHIFPFILNLHFVRLLRPIRLLSFPPPPPLPPPSFPPLPFPPIPTPPLGDRTPYLSLIFPAYFQNDSIPACYFLSCLLLLKFSSHVSYSCLSLFV